MPALYVSNPRDAKGRFRKARKAAASSKAKHKRAKRKPNPQQQPMFTASAKQKRRARRKAKAGGGTAVARTRSPRRKRVGTKAPGPGRKWAYQRNPRRGKGGRFTGRRKGGGRKRNSLTLSNPVGNVPVLGTAVSMLAPAFFGAMGVELIGQSRKMLAKVVTIPEAVEPYEFTIGGLLLAGVVQLFTFIPAPIRHSLGVGLASSGAAVDWFRYRQASGAYGELDMGDGGEWEVQTLGDDDAYGALDLSGIDFSGDEDFCGLDFSMDEGTAMAEGYGAYLQRFPLKKHPRAHRLEDRPRRGTPAQEVHDPRREGDRWHWLAQVFEPEDLKKLANMPPAQRLKQIEACKAACKRAFGRPDHRPDHRRPEHKPRLLPDRLSPDATDDLREHVRYDAFSGNESTF